MRSRIRVKRPANHLGKIEQIDLGSTARGGEEEFRPFDLRAGQSAVGLAILVENQLVVIGIEPVLIESDWRQGIRGRSRKVQGPTSGNARRKSVDLIVGRRLRCSYEVRKHGGKTHPCRVAGVS